MLHGAVEASQVPRRGGCKAYPCRILPALSDSPFISLSLTLSSPSDRAGLASPHPSDGGSAAHSGSQQIYGPGV